MSFPLDLHVLGLPPAFNLSHDQTLQFKILWLNEYWLQNYYVILKLLPFQQNGNELTVPKLSKLNFVLVTQFIEIKFVTEVTVLSKG